MDDEGICQLCGEIVYLDDENCSICGADLILFPPYDYGDEEWGDGGFEPSEKVQKEWQ